MSSPQEDAMDQIYGTWADTYGSEISAGYVSQLKIDLLNQYIKTGDRVLDVGCANGLYLKELFQNHIELHGIDITQNMLVEAISKLEESNQNLPSLYRMTASQLGFCDHSFDLTYSYSTLSLVKRVEKAIGEIWRVTKPGGKSILDLSGTYNLSRLYWSRFYKKEGHFGISTFSFGDVTQLLEDVGFKILEVHAFGFLDQWKYIPGLRRLKRIGRFIHHGPGPDLDYRISNKFPFNKLASRWIFAVEKT